MLPKKAVCKKCPRCIPSGEQGWSKEDEKLWKQGFVYCGFFKHYQIVAPLNEFPFPWCEYVTEHIVS